MPSLIRGINHSSFTVNDLDKSRDFYGRVLGLESVPRPDFGIPGIWYGCGDLQIHLIGRRHPQEREARLSPGENHLALEVDDTSAVVARLRTEGVEVMELPNSPTGRKQVFCLDPDGNVLEFIGDR